MLGHAIAIQAGLALGLASALSIGPNNITLMREGHRGGPMVIESRAAQWHGRYVATQGEPHHPRRSRSVSMFGSRLRSATGA